MSNDTEDRLTRLEAAVSNGLHIDLAEYDTPDQADARAKEAKKAAEAEAKLIEDNRQAAADKETADAKAATDLSLAKSADLEAQQQAERDANAKAAKASTSTTKAAS